jgi:hypothetical protein
VPLPTPILDDRSYQQLRDELVRRIPVYAPTWTDHNASDPGITLIELFAFLGENLLYRFNQIPEATRLAFLRLLRVPMRPAVASRALITMARTDTALTELLVPMASEARAGAVLFETLTEVDTWPLDVSAMVKVGTTLPATGEARDFALAAKDARRLGRGETPAYYLTEVVPNDPAAPGATATNTPSAVDHALWIAVLAIKAADIAQLSKALGKALINIGFIPDDEVPTIDDVSACPGASFTGDAAADMVWQASTNVVQDDDPKFESILVEGDTTAGLTQQGVVRLRLPDDATTLGTPTPSDPYLVGTGDFPPEIEDADKASRVIFWLRVTRRRENDRPIARTLFVGINATEVVQTRKANPEFLGLGSGDADQTFKFINKPVIVGTALVQVEEDGGWTDWSAVDGFEASESDARHYVLDPEAGTVRFGNGIKGRAPQIAERVRVKEYRYGGGDQGNVAANAIAKLSAFGAIKSNNPLAARGGGPAETIADALDRVPGEIRRRDRAVTRDDFSELALATPGAGVGRAECLPLFFPPTRDTEAAGVVSVVVWPRDDRKHPNAPTPDRTLLRQVCQWLDARRLVTTELYVIPPTYREVAVSVGLKAKSGFGIEAVRRWVELVLRQYLAPLPPYGPDGGGWPLGRRVYGPELEAAALQVEGVEYLEGLRVAMRDAKGNWQQAPGQLVTLKSWEVPELSEITVVEGQPLTPGDVLGPATPAGVTVPIPTVKQEC